MEDFQARRPERPFVSHAFGKKKIFALASARPVRKNLPMIAFVRFFLLMPLSVVFFAACAPSVDPQGADEKGYYKTGIVQGDFFEQSADYAEKKFPPKALKAFEDALNEALAGDLSALNAIRAQNRMTTQVGPAVQEENFWIDSRIPARLYSPADVQKPVHRCFLPRRRLGLRRLGQPRRFFARVVPAGEGQYPGRRLPPCARGDDK